MSDLITSKIRNAINSDNYLINCYINLTNIKSIHFLFILIEIFLNLFQELELFINDFSLENATKKKFILNYNSLLIYYFNKIPQIAKLISIFIIILIFDLLYIFIKTKKFRKNNIFNIIIINLLELFYFRAFMLIFLDMFCTLKEVYFIIGCFIIFIHISLTINNFFYNHLYYFVPPFINYPYDEFSSLFDIILLINKIIISLASTTNILGLTKFFFFILFTKKIIISFYLLNLLKNHSYYFMQNSFTNKTRLIFFLSNTIIIIFALLFGKNEIINPLFLIIFIDVLIILIIYIYFLYNIYNYIIIKRETPLENIIFYFFILTKDKDYEFIIEKKINNHYEKCGKCDLCKKYIQYLKANDLKDEELEKFINNDNSQKNNEKISYINLFDVLYDEKNKYFYLMKKILLNSNRKNKENINNNIFYYSNLLFLIYTDYQKKDITLSLNEIIILYVLNQEKLSIIDNNEIQITQLLLCNSFITLSNKIFTHLKDIIHSEPNFIRIKKLIDLSLLLKEMKSEKYKDNLFSHKLENASNSNHLILICSIIYEEIFNTVLSSSQLPIRDNIQSLEDLFHNNSYKINRIITLSIDIINKKSKIIRAGKDLYSYINYDFFNLFPLVFKKYQIEYIISVILENDNVKEKNNDNFNKINRDKFPRNSIKNEKGDLKLVNNIKNKKEFIEMNLIITDKISSKIYFKLISLRLTPLFNNNNNYFIIFDGTYYIYKNTIITLQDFEENLNAKEKLIAVSEPELENNNNHSISIKKFINLQNNMGLNITKILSFKIAVRIYNIYLIEKRNKEIEKKKIEKKVNSSKENTNKDEVEEDQIINNKNIIIEDTASVNSQQTGNSYNTGISSLGIRNKKKDNIYEYGGFNKVRNIITFVILTSFVILVIEYLILKTLQNDTENNNNSLLDFREFYKLYFQLFSSILGVSSIYNNSYINLINIFEEKYFSIYNETIFNYTLFVNIQNEILAKKIMSKRNYLSTIHKCIGSEKYNELFGKKVNYFRIIQSLSNGYLTLNLTSVNIEFSEAILIICNSFQILANGTNNPVFFLNKEEGPFSILNNNKYNDYLNNFQKEFYEMILNFKIYYSEFNYINTKLNEIIFSQSNFIQIFIYFYLTLNTLIILVMGTCVYIYTIFFEIILIKIINLINMTMNNKNDDFNFSDTFSKKIENLETISQFYKYDPVNSVENLNNIYNKYQQFLSSKNKKKNTEMNKKNYKKIVEDNKKNELDDIPKNQRIMTSKDIKTLGITFIYEFIYYLNFVIFVTSFITLLIIWTNYFSKKSNLYSLIQKNISLELSIYRGINFYDLMIFHNYTIDEISIKILSNYSNNEKNYLIKTFYDDLELAFNFGKEINVIGELYEDFDKSNFTCDILLKLISDNIKEIEDNEKSKNLNNITENLFNLCEFSRITESNDYRTVFERHFQYIKNGMLSINDFSYDGLIKHIIENGSLSRISVLFNSFMIYILEITNSEPCRNSIKKLLSNLKKLVIITEFIYLIFDFIAIFIVKYLYINGINNLCSQIFVLRNIFKIYEFRD